MKMNGEKDSQREAEKGACFVRWQSPTAFEKGAVREGVVAIGLQRMKEEDGIWVLKKDEIEMRSVG